MAIAPRLALFVGALVAAPVAAQWPANPAANLALADAAGEQSQPKIRAAPDGGAYISWFDNGPGGWDVRIQRVDAAGNEQLPHGGILIADRSFSSTQDYDLEVDPSGDALLTFRDDRTGSVQITATRVAPDGTQRWGAMGVQLTSDAAFHAAPKIAATSDGHIVVGWTNDSTVKFQRLDGAGAATWGAGVVLSGAVGFGLSDLGAADGGSVIASWAAQNFPGPRHLYAQKLSAAGAPLWGGGSPVIVFDGGSIQNGNFPTFVSDGAGGAVFGWYGVGPLQCYVQRIRSDGAEVFPHNGVAASTNAAQIRVSPSVAYDPAAGETFLFWTEQNSLQSMWGVYGQKFNSFGARQWTDAGRVIVPVDATERTQVRTLQFAGGAMVFFVDKPSPPSGQRVLGARVDGTGAFVWTPALPVVSSLLAGKSRLDASLSKKHSALLTWADTRTDANDVYAQNVNAGGSLGPKPGDFDGNGCIGFADLTFLLNAWGTCPGGPCPADLDGNGSVGFADLNLLLADWG